MNGKCIVDLGLICPSLHAPSLAHLWEPVCLELVSFILEVERVEPFKQGVIETLSLPPFPSAPSLPPYPPHLWEPVCLELVSFILKVERVEPFEH